MNDLQRDDLEESVTHERPRPKSSAPKPLSNVPKDTDPHGISASMDLVAKIGRIDISNAFQGDPGVYKCLVELIRKSRVIRRKFKDKGEGG